MKNMRILLSFILLIFLSPVLFSQSYPGIFLNDWQPKYIDDLQGIEVNKPQNTTEIVVTVNVTDTVTKVSKYMFGGNLNPYSPVFTKTPSSLENLKKLSPNVLRWPGGNLSNEYFWNATPTTLPADLPSRDDIGQSTQSNWWVGTKPGSTDLSLEDYYNILDATGSTGSICVNYSYARYGLDINAVAKAAHLAAEWVRYDNGRTKFWEIGNENYGNWQTGYKIKPELYPDPRPEYISGAIYGDHSSVFIDSMRKAATDVGAEIYIGVQAWEDYTSWDPIQTAWNDGLMPRIGDKADFIIVHNYYTPYKDNSTIPTIFKSLEHTPHFTKVVGSKLKQYGFDPLPVALTEYNIQSRDSGQLISYINGMHATMVIGDAMRYGFGMTNRWSTVGFWGGEPGGMGTFSYNGETGVPEGNMRPEFYYMYYFQKMFGDVMVKSVSSDTTSVVSYASTYASGQCGMVLVNKNKEKKTVEINLNNFEPGTDYHYYILTGGADNGSFSANVYVNGQGSPYPKGGPSSLYDKLKPYSSETNGKIVVNAPGYSAIFMIIEGKERPGFQSARLESNDSTLELFLTLPIAAPVSSDGFSILANGSESIAISGIDIHGTDSSVLMLTLGRAITKTDSLTISYSGGKIKTSDGRPLNPFSDKIVDNLLPGAPPRLLSAQTFNKQAVNLVFNKKMRQVSSAGFTLSKNAEMENLTIDTAYFNGTDSTQIYLSAADSFSYGDTLFLAYSGTALVSIDSGILAPFAIIVENTLPPVAPVLDSAILDIYGTKLTLYYNQLMANASGQVPYFTLKADDKTLAIKFIGSIGNRVVIQLAETVPVNSVVVLNYSGGSLTSYEGMAVPDIVDLEIENNVIIVFKPKYISNVTINASGNSYQLDIAQTGKVIYSDRSYLFTQLHDSVINAEFIRWKNELKTFYAPVLLSFTVKTSGKVYVAHDDRLARPSWLTSGFSQTTYKFPVPGTQMTLFQKTVEKDDVITCGANQVQGTETTESTHYIVFFDPDRYLTDIKIHKNDFQGINLFPNPAKNELYIGPVALQGMRYSIFDFTGKQLQQGVLAGDPICRISFNLSPGLYMLKLYKGFENTYVKFLVE